MQKKDKKGVLLTILVIIPFHVNVQFVPQALHERLF